VRKLLQRREQARQEGDYAAADKIRVEVGELGFIMEDTPSGTVVRRRV